MLSSDIAVAQSVPDFYISGTIVSGETNLPGVIVTAKSSATGKTFSTVSDDQGRYRLSVPALGTYRVKVELFGFSPANRVLSTTEQTTRADFRLTLTTVESSAANHHPPAPEPAAANESPQQASPGGGVAKRSLPLSADMPLEFSFVTGQVGQPVTAGSVGGELQSPVHGSVDYQAGNSALDASPYALHGITAEKPEYAHNSFGGN